MKWITRERPKIDRIACPWLITRFIDKAPELLFVPSARVIVEIETAGAIRLLLSFLWISEFDTSLHQNSTGISEQFYCAHDSDRRRSDCVFFSSNRRWMSGMISAKFY